MLSTSLSFSLVHHTDTHTTHVNTHNERPLEGVNPYLRSGGYNKC